MFLMFFFRSTKNKSHKKINKNMKKHTSSKTPIKPTKYQHFHLPGRSRGPPQTTKITPGAPLDPPRHPQKTSCVFRASRGPPQGPPETPQGRPGTPQGRPGNPQGTPNTPQGPPQRPPGTPRGRPGTPGISRSRSSWISRSSSPWFRDPPGDSRRPPRDP